MVLVFYKPNSAIERGTKPYMLGCKPCHWTSTLKAAMVNARRASKYAHTDGASLSSTPLGEVFGEVPHQICELHIIAEVGKAVLEA